MAARVVVGSNPINLHKFRPSFQTSHQSPFLPVTTTSHRRGFLKLVCQSNPDPLDSQKEESTIKEACCEESATKPDESSQDAGLAQFPNRSINRNIALATAVAAVGLFASSRLDFGVSLKDLSVAALPYEVAIANGKPTVVEFYADWCEVCRELAPDVYKVEQQYKDKVNFVMMNVDNTKWEQELDEFGVEGIPHFTFLDREGNEEGNVVGRLPRQYLLENVDALAKGEASVPHARAVGDYTSAEKRKVHRITDPRSHGG